MQYESDIQETAFSAAGGLGCGIGVVDQIVPFHSSAIAAMVLVVGYKGFPPTAMQNVAERHDMPLNESLGRGFVVAVGTQMAGDVVLTLSVVGKTKLPCSSAQIAIATGAVTRAQARARAVPRSCPRIMFHRPNHAARSQHCNNALVDPSQWRCMCPHRVRPKYTPLLRMQVTGWTDR